MIFRYLAFGLKVSSALELPELGGESDFHGEADLEIRVCPLSDYASYGTGSHDNACWIDPQNFWIRLETVGQFLVSNGRSINVMADANADTSMVRAFLLGSACGVLLVQRGFLVLHGNAIRVGGGCLVCVGDSGSGKSTLAAGFLKRGYQVLADDVVAVDATGSVVPGFPRIKLWQDAADKLGLSTEGRTRVAPNMDKYNLPISAFEPNARLPIRWIYHLTKGNGDEIAIDPVSGLPRFRLLRDNTYRNEYLDGHEMIGDHLNHCSHLAGKVHFATVVRPAGGYSLEAIIDRLLVDIESNGYSDLVP